jgi:ATP-dependent Clp protease ATP-binding subunit ClpX
MESIMLDVMYDVPSHPEIEEVVVSQEVVENKEQPIVVYTNASRTG